MTIKVSLHYTEVHTYTLNERATEDGTATVVYFFTRSYSLTNKQYLVFLSQLENIYIYTNEIKVDPYFPTLHTATDSNLDKIFENKWSPSQGEN